MCAYVFVCVCVCMCMCGGGGMHTHMLTCLCSFAFSLSFVKNSSVQNRKTHLEHLDIMYADLLKWDRSPGIFRGHAIKYL